MPLRTSEDSKQACNRSIPDEDCQKSPCNRREVPNTQMYPPESNRNAPSGYDIGLDIAQHRLKAASLIVLSLENDIFNLLFI